MKTLLLAAAVSIVALASPAFAKRLAVPSEDPAVTLVIPDTWEMKEIKYGYQAISPGKDVAFYVEYAAGKRVKEMTDLNNEWLKENSIKTIGKPEEKELDFNGISGSVLKYKATDENGATNINFAFLPAGRDRVIMLTLWGSDAEQEKHGQDVNAILGSIKPIQ